MEKNMLIVKNNTLTSVRIGIIGVGIMGSGHAEYLLTGQVEKSILTCLCDIDSKKFIKFANIYPKLQCYTDYKEMITSGNVDAVIIATPHYFHPEMAIFAFEHGMHVISEKPMGVEARNVMRMNTAAIESGKVFSSMFCVRTDPNFRKIREMIMDGSLGKIKRVTWIKTDWYRPQAYHDSANWRSSWKTEGGGMLINQSPHNLDMIQWFFGMPDEITAQVSFGKYYDIEVEDEVIVHLHYKDFICTYISSTGEYPGSDRLEIACEMGLLVFENGKICFRKTDISEREFNKSNKDPNARPGMQEIYVEPLQGMMHHKYITQNFVNAILNGEELIAPGLNGLNEVEICNGIYMSAWTGKTVSLPVCQDDFCNLLQQKIKESEK